MKIVILCAGKGNRMGDLTKDLPKPLLEYRGKSLLEHKLDILPKDISEIILVIGYLGEKIKERIGNEYSKIPVRFIEQKELLGTAHALFQCKEYLNEDFIVLMGDDIYGEKDILNLAKSNEWSFLVHRLNNSDSKDDDINSLEIKGKILTGKIGDKFIYTGACCLTPKIFNVEMIKIESGEYGLPQTLAKELKNINIKAIESNNWKNITSPEDLI